MICAGKSPQADKIIAFKKGEFDRATREMIPAHPRKATRGNRVFLEWTWRNGRPRKMECLNFTPSKCRVQKQYVELIESEHPKAKWFAGNVWGKNGERPLLRILPNQTVVAVIMPIRQKDR